MGAGGRSSSIDADIRDREPHSTSSVSHKLMGGESHERAPHSKPPFTLAQLKKAIPPHCFNRSIVKSSAYLLLDLLISGSLLYATSFITKLGPVGWIAWILYWIVQGCVLTGVWVIAHECGHHAFSDYSLVDNVVGLILHSSLLVPFFSWKYSHRRHHSNTGSMTRDEVFLPKTKDRLGIAAIFLNNPIGRLLSIIVTLLLGWPLYLIFNVSGRPYDRFASHFDPNGPIFNNRERLQVVISDLALLTVGACLFKLASIYGTLWLLKVYVVPLLIVNGFLVLITYLQHTHPSLPHYADAEWEWLRGALSTVDRNYGILNHVFHHITDTHVTHHIFSTMPHYHAAEATEEMKPILGQYYQFDSTPIPLAVWREFKECVFVEESPEEKGVYWYKNKFDD
ncbi:hypothetical protein KP509_12G038300 [Ceratopteris richardii]|nr:hypothetical protein KP509_12G038300 [Ceratopteris richardii]KAH7423073.1 hypothetical protein KP509_12G038300 [Ceratopteris richardii]KAH7423075.1 hypothetical protein KP509_12G038300 [Ceratopteris richardii]